METRDAANTKRQDWEAANPAAAEEGNAAPAPAEAAVDQTGPLWCVPADAAERPWAGVQQEASKNQHLRWYSDQLIERLRKVTPESYGYYGGGYITVHSLLTSPVVKGDNQGNSWNTLPNQPFDGYALWHVFQDIEDNCAYLTVQVSNDGGGNINNLIRVDHGHYESLLAMGDYVQVTANNMEDLLHGERFLVYMADARGIALILRLGLFRGSDTMRPRPEGFPVEELAFGLATQTGKDGNESQEYWALDF
eukprot:11008054-Heterocapsa_arctica.AAC.1